MHEAVLVFSFPSAISANAIAGALAPESDAAQVPKTRAEITLEGNELHVRVSAEDLSALRAAVNSYARWVDAAERAAGVARG